MIQLLGYNFLSDGDSLNPFPVAVQTIDSITLQNAEFNDFFVTRNVTEAYSTNVPTDWDFYTIMLANFNGDISAGSIDNLVSQVDSIRIKRRKKGEFEWLTIYEQAINDETDFNFSGQDNFAIYAEEYEYAWVPVLAGIEGNYIIESIESKFQGVYICDANTIYKFMAGVSYGHSQYIQQVAVYNPLGRKYPVYVSNGENNYQTGSFTGKLLGNYENTGVFNRKEMVLQKNEFMKWLTNKKAKFIKDYNGNAWCVFIIGEPSVSYDNQWGMGMMDTNFDYGELCDAEDIAAMQDVGLIPVLETE